MAPFKRRRIDSKSKGDYVLGSKTACGTSIIQGDDSLAAKNGLRSVDEVAHTESARSNNVTGSDGTDSENEKLLSEEEDDGIKPGFQNPYNILLQALNANAKIELPSRKKRKHGFNKAPEHPRDFLDLGEPGQELGDPSGPETESESHSEVEVNEQSLDSFTKHYKPLDELLLDQIQAIKDNKWLAEKDNNSNLGWVSHLRIPGTADTKATSWPKEASRVHDLDVKHKFEENATRLLPAFEKPIGRLASAIFDYQDVLFSGRSMKNTSTIRSLISIHIVNHIFKTRDKVLKNKARLARASDGEDLELRDQGFTRPKVLVLLPTRQSCVEVVDIIMTLCQPEQQENKKRFQDAYMSEGKKFSENKPDDFKHLFGGNDDDMFRLGMKFTRKSVKFFSHFYSSDIILASPLGLRMALEGDKSRKQDYDFLSSIEIVVVDQSEALLMQNWEHVECIFEHLNLQPKEAHGCDFSRVRNWYLDGNARYLRQTILFSAFNFPSLNKLYTQNMLNVIGKLKISRTYDGAIGSLGIPIRQTFLRFDTKSAVSEPDDRFNYFITAILPSIVKHASHDVRADQGILLYVPLYADFIRVRNHLAASPSTQNISFGSISEYTSVRDVARARSHFLSGRHSILLYTERAHHFRRYRIRGVKSLVLYGLPENPIFYEETVGGYLGSSIAEAKVDTRQAGVRNLFSRLDVLKLERIVGTRRYLKLLSDIGDTFDFT